MRLHGTQWWPLYARALAALFGVSAILLGSPSGQPAVSPATALLPVVFLATGLLGTYEDRLGQFRAVAGYAAVAFELALVSLIVYLTGGAASVLSFLYVPVLIWGAAGRGVVAGVTIGWLAALGFATAAGGFSDPSAEVIPRGALFLLTGLFIGLLEQRRHEAEASVLQGAQELMRREQAAAEIRAALLAMAPLDLSGRAGVLLRHALRIGSADEGLVCVLDAEGRPVVEAAAGRPGSARPRGEVLPDSAVLADALRAGVVQQVTEAGRDARWVSVFGNTAGGSALLIPLTGSGSPFGALFLARRDVRLFRDEAVDGVRGLAEMAAVQLQDARAHVQAHDFHVSAVNALTSALEAKDSYTRGHSQRVASSATSLAAELGLPGEEIERIRWASLLHDIGKIATPETILRKNGPLSDEERAIVNQHPERGAGILDQMPPFRQLAGYVRYHQEAWDGSGYPEGLAGSAIPLGARVIRIADTFDALISDRPYRRSRTIEEAIAELRAMAGTALDPELAEAFVRLLRAKPPFDVQLRMWRAR